MTFAVVISATDPDRIAEALRAALGIGLRGATVQVHLAPEAAALNRGQTRPDVARAVATLQHLGHPVVAATDDAIAAAIRSADRVEVWT